MTWRELFAKLLWLAGLVGYPVLLVKSFDVSLLEALAGGLALAFVTPLVFVVLMGLLDPQRAPPKAPPAQPAQEPGKADP